MTVFKHSQFARQLIACFAIALLIVVFFITTSILYLAETFLFIFFFVCILYFGRFQALPLKQLNFSIRNIVGKQCKLDMPYLATNERINTEMLTAQRMQQSFLSKHINLPPNLELAAELQQSRKVGGDLFHFFVLDNRLYFAVGDVAGKGIPAAIYMASVAKLFQYIAKQYQSTATICNVLNEQMCLDHEADMYVTMFVGILDIDTGHLTYTNAGHTYPLIIHENGTTNFLVKYPDAPIGVLEGYTFDEHTYTLDNDCSVLLYTDGITDAENEAGQFYGTEKLVECVENATSKSPQQVLQAVIKDIEKHIETRHQSDDLTLLMLRYYRKDFHSEE